MISDHDRSYYIGASDTQYVIGNWDTKSFERWYLTKLCVDSSHYSNDAMKAGTAYEHRILESLNLDGLEMDRQIIHGRLRVNLDGNTKDTVYEVKTYMFGKRFKPSKAYREQVQVEMYATGLRKAFIVAYALQEDDYRNFFRTVEAGRLSFHPIEYDAEFITKMYLPRLERIIRCLDDGRFPREAV